MAMHSVTHVALRVDRLREAETFYRSLFALEVTFGRPRRRTGGGRCLSRPTGTMPNGPGST